MPITALTTSDTFATWYTRINSLITDVNSDSAADNFTVSANNSTNETVYPIFVDGATGSQGAETDTGLSYNPSTGVFTTTSVTGNLTGNVTGNTSGTAATVTGAAQSAITSLGTISSLTISSPDTSALALTVTSDGNSTCASFNQTTSGEVGVAIQGGGTGSGKIMQFTNSSGTVTGFITDSGNIEVSGSVTASGDVLGWPKGYLYNADIGVAASDTNHDLDFPAIRCRDNADTQNITATSYVKQCDVAFAEGTNAGGMADSQSLPTSGTIHLFIIEKDSSAGTFDFMCDVSVTGANGVSGWTVQRRIGSRRTDASANIINVLQDGDEHQFTTPRLVYSASNPGTSAVDLDIGTPENIELFARFGIFMKDQSPGGTDTFMIVTSLASSMGGPNPTSALNDLQIDGSQDTNENQTHENIFIVQTNTSAQIRYKLTNTETDLSVYINVRGWVDRRGQDG